MSNLDDPDAIIREDAGGDADIHDTTDPDEIFQTTRTRLELALRDYNSVIKSKFRWFNALVLFITALSVVLAANFEKTLGMSADSWETIFIVIAVISLMSAVYDFSNWLWNREDANTEAVMQELRKDTSDDN